MAPPHALGLLPQLRRRRRHAKKNGMKIDAAVPASISKHPHDGREEAHCTQCRHHKHPTLYCFHDAAINLIRDSRRRGCSFPPRRISRPGTLYDDLGTRPAGRCSAGIVEPVQAARSARPSKPISAIGNDPWCTPLVFYSAAECVTSEAARRLGPCKPSVS